MVYWNEPRPLIYDRPKFHQSKLCWKGSCVLKSVFWSRRSTSQLQTSVCDPSKTRAQTVAQLHDETWELSATVTQKPKECEGQWTQLDRWTVYPGTHRLACFFTFPSAQPACVVGCGHILLWPVFDSRSSLANSSGQITGDPPIQLQYRTHKVMLLPPWQELPSNRSLPKCWMYESEHEISHRWCIPD